MTMDRPRPVPPISRERLGDHCFNLSIALRRRNGEMSERHSSLSKQEIEKTHDFRLLLEEYGKRYGI